MMAKRLAFTLFLCLSFGFSLLAQTKYPMLFEQTEGKQTPPYHEVISYFKQLSADFEEVKMVEMGISDAGLPFHVILLDKAHIFDPKQWHESNRPILFINNGIHPGEPDGIDASMMLLRDILEGKIPYPEELALAIIPVYNIGGHLNRNSFSRVNQNGPEEHGFRGNARNYDLNRDFIKADTRNGRSFQQIFQWLSPQVFVDTHVSNGADYQHVMTLISTESNRLGGAMGNYLRERLDPELYKRMDVAGYPMIPYVNAYGGKPEDGWSQFKDLGRYSSGYASLFGTASFMPETHMLKPYKDRVASTYELLKIFIQLMGEDGSSIVKAYQQDRAAVKSQKTFAFQHTLDRSKYRMIPFHGYQSAQKPSEVSGLPRLYYDRNQPFSTEVKFFETYEAKLEISKPTAYIIPQGWHHVIENLKRNGVSIHTLEKDSTLEVTVYHIQDFQTAQRPFEGHYLHSNTSISKSIATISFRAGDIIIPMNQERNKFVMEVLEPESEDSFFNWNFFDTILQSKEGYSAYVFEDLAAEFLKENPSLRKVLEEAKESDENLRNNAAAQLRWVYERSPWKEQAHNRYPVYRLEK
ncbi:M14 family zinc carboxypeptidase [Mongoliitalea daihaiensis]|uniref:M14 family zinc carboxypeptidase n=1 Tax=Mongoliitalea daihaiensis TaxID=2782006 RepID=UPI00374D65DA|nr:hypothetical protein IPZ59_06040 [Mongoliitalea daihaiensis]